MEESMPAGASNAIFDICACRLVPTGKHLSRQSAVFNQSNAIKIWRIAMDTSRRELMEVFGASAAALVAAGGASRALAQQVPTLQPDLGSASTAESELKIVNFDILEEDTKKILSPGRFAFMGPAGDGWTYRENRRAFNDFPIMPRRLQGISDTIDLRIKLLGHDLPFPMITAPMGAQGMIHVNAELASAGGTGMTGALYVLSGASTKPMEDIAKATPGPKWFQIYMLRDMEINRWLVKRARAAGFSAIVLTADALGPGQSDDFIRLGRPFPPNMGPGNHDPALGGRGNFEDKKRDLSYSDIGFLREASGLPVIVKGLLNVEDVRQSLAAGANAIWVSNHGGRQIDGVPASISMLRAAVDAVEGRAPVILDSGVRRGIDVFKALALGATAVAVGRPVLWASAVGGAPGVNSVYTHLAGEMKSAMLLSGVAKVGDIGREHVVLAKA
jgi:L-lactate oxidase